MDGIQRDEFIPCFISMLFAFALGLHLIQKCHIIIHFSRAILQEDTQKNYAVNRILHIAEIRFKYLRFEYVTKCLFVKCFCLILRFFSSVM